MVAQIHEMSWLREQAEQHTWLSPNDPEELEQFGLAILAEVERLWLLQVYHHDEADVSSIVRKLTKSE